jgi:hypothetical protein
LLLLVQTLFGLHPNFFFGSLSLSSFAPPRGVWEGERHTRTSAACERNRGGPPWDAGLEGQPSPMGLLLSQCAAEVCPYRLVGSRIERRQATGSRHYCCWQSPALPQSVAH